jgi:hypothetical protein
MRDGQDGEDRKRNWQHQRGQGIATDSVQKLSGTRQGMDGSIHGWILVPKAEMGSGIEAVA